MRTALIILAIAIPLWMAGGVFALGLCRAASLGDRQLRRAMEAEAYADDTTEEPN